jgi:apolipoprotein N-acyltransferase
MSRSGQFRAGWGALAYNAGAVVCAVLLFAASFPNPLVSGGIPWCAWVAFVPVFWLVGRVSPGAAAVWGALYGYAAYTVFNFWLSAFHPLAGVAAGVVFLIFFALLFVLFKLAVILFPRRGYIVQWLIWIGWEYLRTLGFTGYAYGIAGYSQWQVLPVIQIAALFGVWGVSALVVFPSAYLAAALRGWNPRVVAPPGGGEPPVSGVAENRARLAGLRFGAQGVRRPAPRLRGEDARPPLKNFFRREWLPGALWLLALALTLAYGFLAPRDYSGAPTVRTALIQHNTDPWKGGIAQYRGNFQTLKRLSREALAAGPRPDMVVWSETAFIPRIYWYTQYRDDPSFWALVQELLVFLREQDVPFVIGNDDARKEPPKNPGEHYRVDYNAVLLFREGVLVDQYRKLHLVPFTEYFPYQKRFPWIYEALIKADTHLWERGDRLTVFEIPRAPVGADDADAEDDAGTPVVKFSTPICFEDTFGYLSRDFVRLGAELIVNVTNDAWSGSRSAQMQHLAMAVFRAVENRRSLVRAAASGQTCGIDPEGRIIAMAPAFEEAWLTVDVPLLRELTPYTRFGDIWGQIFAVLGALVLLIGIVAGIIKRFSGSGSSVVSRAP